MPFKFDLGQRVVSLVVLSSDQGEVPAGTHGMINYRHPSAGGQNMYIIQITNLDGDDKQAPALEDQLDAE